MIEEGLRVTAPIDQLQLPPGTWPKQVPGLRFPVESIFMPPDLLAALRTE